MTILEAFYFGLLQGLSEFLPISSSGHLAILKELFSLREIPILFDIMLHLATLAAVIIVFRKKLLALIQTAFRFIIRKTTSEDGENLRYILALIVGTFCTGLLGLGLQKFLPALSVKTISFCFILTAAILILGQILARAHKDKLRPVGLKDGIITGIAQGIGVIPGISRSGITISAALASGLPRAEAGELSFLLSIPAILGAFILELKDADTLVAQVEIAPLLVGLITAFISGFIALTLLLRLIRKGSLAWFAIWLLPLGTIGLLFL